MGDNSGAPAALKKKMRSEKKMGLESTDTIAALAALEVRDEPTVFLHYVKSEPLSSHSLMRGESEFHRPHREMELTCPTKRSLFGSSFN
jgi:hypothetical protein